ncbi:MAG: uncharacterized protein QG574_5631 [Cyanobacteriota bacterium erpe_2018_sw_21hr_WHONDRS-SW48-000092_B_bin.40]|jgi:uncharacterized protein YwgA|nr:uncharacterized protein [Cyanobacteriota bacterium erpe_2018_sw_21hr_WHONDRS-SW48-000092_B_bin.40]
MDFNERLEKLKMLLSAAGSTVQGRKKLQKLAYLCQAAGEPLGQSFTFYHYGVYSPTLADDIRAAASMKLVDEIDGLHQVVTKLKKPVAVSNTKGFALVTKLADKEARLLEVLTTILYLRYHGYTGEGLKAKLTAIKGQHSEFFANAFELANSDFKTFQPC